MPRRNGAKELFLHSPNNPERILPERGLPETTGIQPAGMHPVNEHGPALWLFAAGALACFLGAVLIAARGTRR